MQDQFVQSFENKPSNSPPVEGVLKCRQEQFSDFNKLLLPELRESVGEMYLKVQCKNANRNANRSVHYNVTRGLKVETC